MTEVQSTEIDQARAALDLARAYHAGAVLAARHRPEDPQTQHRVADAVQQGRGAWKAYQAAAKGRQIARIEAITPSAFREV